MHECFPEHLRMGTTRMKEDKEAEKVDKQKITKMERSNLGTQ